MYILNKNLNNYLHYRWKCDTTYKVFKKKIKIIQKPRMISFDKNRLKFSSELKFD